MHARNSRSRRAFTIVELMITVAIVGILAALAVYGVRAYLLSAKSAEATHNLGAIGRRAAEAYTRENMNGSLLAPTASASITKGLCGSAAATIPTSAAAIKGAKYMSSPAEWQAGDKTTGWKCLRFELISPQYYMYGYTSDGTNFTATADGDLAGTGTTAQYKMVGQVVSSTVLLAPKVQEPTSGGGCAIARGPAGVASTGIVAGALAVLVARRRRRR